MFIYWLLPRSTRLDSELLFVKGPGLTGDMGRVAFYRLKTPVMGGSWMGLRMDSHFSFSYIYSGSGVRMNFSIFLEMFFSPF